MKQNCQSHFSAQSSDSGNMDLKDIFEDSKLKILLQYIRSEDETEKNITISLIPNLILESLRKRNDVLDQLILVIYNLRTKNPNNYDILNGSNRITIFRNLMRLYSGTIQKHSPEQVAALAKIVDHVHSSELLVELAYVLHKCSAKLAHESDTYLIEGALGAIEEKAASGLSSEALLMIRSIATK